ncbi:hypothetical protein Rsub_04300 [Raphidocelis subcapitata]|uniref:Cation efflux protein transmembrane domain-containing protein n=1 Tax=Raphidocelis subcapitata TaxID=307507 RepID=A0A2V0P151_9CHLO|nr:hypothetical protein Rsub_04300 [Raphidocelis subcapitata]|eukprot:GBF91560.1 hypothetical protein Rsub_04300 [Raphidocelis subcapitata]
MPLRAPLLAAPPPTAVAAAAGSRLLGPQPRGAAATPSPPRPLLRPLLPLPPRARGPAPPPRAAAAAAGGFSSAPDAGDKAAAGAGAPAGAAAGDDEDDNADELHAVDTAIRANILIFVAKLSVYFISSSSAMLAEAVHSLVDVANQMLLRIGIKKAEKGPTKAHPFGYSRDQFVWPLISAVGIFCCGAGISFIHGVQGLFEPHEVGPLFWNFVVLGVSLVLESHSLRVAVAALTKRAKQQGMTLWNYVKTGSDPAATAVMLEDGAAVAGLVIAAGCLGLCHVTGNAVWDSVGSLAVAGLLGVVAVTLIQRNRKWLIGKSMPSDQEAVLVAYLRQQSVVRSVTNVKSEEIGVRQYRFQADVAFDGAELARRCLDRVGRQRLFRALAAAAARRDAAYMDALLMQFATVTVSAVGAEVDRMEQDITRLVPGTRYVDLETDRGKPIRPPSPDALAAAAAAAERRRPAAGVAGVVTDPGAEGDHLADLVYYPLGSVTSVDSIDDTGDWVARLEQQQRAAAAAGEVSGAAAGGAWLQEQQQQQRRQQERAAGADGQAGEGEGGNGGSNGGSNGNSGSSGGGGGGSGSGATAVK